MELIKRVIEDYEFETGQIDIIKWREERRIRNNLGKDTFKYYLYLNIL